MDVTVNDSVIVINRKKIMVAWVIVGIFLVVTACSSAPRLISGHVVAKHRDAAYDYTTYICTGRDKSGNCMVNVPMYHHEPQHFYVTVEGDDSKGKHHKQDEEVSEDYYQTTTPSDDTIWTKGDW